MYVSILYSKFDVFCLIIYISTSCVLIKRITFYRVKDYYRFIDTYVRVCMYFHHGRYG